MWTDPIISLASVAISIALWFSFFGLNLRQDSDDPLARETVSWLLRISLMWGLACILVTILWFFLGDEWGTFWGRVVSGSAAFLVVMVLLNYMNVDATRKQNFNDLLAKYAESLNQFPEYLPERGNEVAVVMKDAHFPPSIKPKVEAVIQNHIHIFSLITKSELINKLYFSINPQYDLEYALANQRPGGKLQDIASTLDMMSMRLSKLAAYDEHGEPLRKHLDPYLFSQLPKEIADEIGNIRVRFKLPDNLRTTHHQIISASGHGKTSLIQSMILDDLEEDAAIVVIDSQNRMINELAEVVPLNRVVLIDPEFCPPALNIFANAAKDEKSVANALQLYEYIFGALEAGMTSKQTLVYRYISRLCMLVPGANLGTMRDMLQTGGVEPYRQYIDMMGDNAKTFFNEFTQAKNQFNETRLEVLRRLLTVMESDTFARMLGATENKVDLARMLDVGKVVLISTNKELLKGNAALLGRIFLAQVMQAVMSRKEGAKRVYLYVDEFKDYAEDSDILLDLFSQSRKYNMAMVVCHQELSQLTPKLAATISTNTSIKMVGGVSHEDAARLAKQLQVEPEDLLRLPVGRFMAWFKGIGTMPWSIDPERFKRQRKRNDLDYVRSEMRKKYGPSSNQTPISSPSTTSPAPKPLPRRDTDEESSPW